MTCLQKTYICGVAREEEITDAWARPSGDLRSGGGRRELKWEKGILRPQPGYPRSPPVAYISSADHELVPLTG